MEKLIHFLISHNHQIIYVLVGAICFLSAIVVWNNVFGKKGPGHDTVSVDLSGIEESLKKILSQTHSAITTTGAVADGTLVGVVNAAGQPITDAAGVKKELEERAKIIESLKTEVASFKDQTPSTELLGKIKNLEGRLAEYGIIEDDIADLSQYKEENAKLKKELDSLKRAGPQMVDQFAAAVNEAAPAGAAPVTPPPAAEPANVLKSEAAPPVASSDEALAAAVAAAQESVNADQQAASKLAEFSKAAEKKAEPPPPAAAAEATPVAAPVAASAAPAAAVPEAPAEAKGDIFSEFSGGGEEDPLAALGDIDPDRMLDELKDLNADLNVGAEALDEAPDMDKMAQEADGLSKKNG